MIPEARDRPRTDVAEPGHTGASRHSDRAVSDETPPDDDDAALFRSAIGRVRELPRAPAPPAPPKPRPGTRMAELDDAQTLGEFQRLLGASTPLEAGDALRHRRDDVPPRVLRQLAQGRWAVQDELDLHHANTAQAGALLRRFLQDARDADARCVRIVHGKGLNSEGVPVLKNLVDRLLRQRGDVLAFHSAPTAQGGTGAVLVLLKPR